MAEKKDCDRIDKGGAIYGVEWVDTEIEKEQEEKREKERERVKEST